MEETDQMRNMVNKMSSGSKYKPNKMKSTYVDPHRPKIQDGTLSVVLANYFGLYFEQEERNPQFCMATKGLRQSGYQRI